MRKRSCSIHSQTLQGFLQMAEQVQKRTGIFYESLARKNFKKTQQRKNQHSTENFDESPSHIDGRSEQKEFMSKTFYFQNFEFDAQTYEYQRDLKKVQQEPYTRYVKHNIGIVSSGNQVYVRECMGKILNETDSSISQNSFLEDLATERKIDLIRKNLQVPPSGCQFKSSQICLNIWLIDLEQVDSPIIKSYLNIMDKIFVLQDTDTDLFDLESKSYRTFQLQNENKFQYLLQILKDIEEALNLPFIC